MKSNYKILASWSHKKVYTIHCKSWQVLHCIIHVAWSSFTFWCKRYSTQEILLDEDVVWKYEHCSELIQLLEFSNYYSFYYTYLISTYNMTTSNCLRLIASIKFGIFCIVEVWNVFNFYSMKQQYSIKSILCPGMWPWNFIRKRIENLTK